LVAILLMVACSRESTREEPVTSTPSTGTPSTAPPAKQAADRDVALVRVVDAMPDTETDIFAGDNKTFINVSYKDVTPYKELPDNILTFRVRPSGQDTAQPLAENSQALGGGNHYTLIALPGTENKQPDLRVLSDNLTPPPAGKAKVRVIHASPSIKEVDIFEQGKKDALFSGLNPQSESVYKEVAPMQTNLEVRLEDAHSVALTIPDVKFEEGKVYTIAVVGGSNKSPKLEAIVIEDKLESAQAQPGY
jgi:hypothetical protein